jgi:hypothetical protein
MMPPLTKQQAERWLQQLNAPSSWPTSTSDTAQGLGTSERRQSETCSTKIASSQAFDSSLRSVLMLLRQAERNIEKASSYSALEGVYAMHISTAVRAVQAAILIKDSSPGT